MSKKWLMLPIGLAAVALFIFVGGTVVQWLWNWLMPSLFGLRAVTFWEAFGLLALSRILFGGFGKSSHRWKGRGWDRNMSPEERELFRQKMAHRCGMKPSGGTSGPAPSEIPVQ
jgi:hypothetical protein